MKQSKLFSFLILSTFLFGTSFCLQAGATSLDLNNVQIDVSVDEAINNSVKEKITPVVEDVKVMTPNSNTEIKNEVVGQTDSIKETIKKFSFAMLGVLISSLVIYFILSIMNKIALNGGGKISYSNVSDKKTEDFESPDNEDEALKVFFEKSK